MKSYHCLRIALRSFCIVVLCLCSVSVLHGQWVQCKNQNDHGDRYGYSPYSITNFNSTLFVSSVYGLHSSKDYGETWTEFLPKPVFPISCYASIDTTLYTGTDDGFNFISANGTMWVNWGLESVQSMTVLGSNVYALAMNSFIFRTDKDKYGWTKIYSVSDSKISFLSKVDTTLFIGTERGDVFRTTGNDTNWLKISSGLPGRKITSFEVIGTTVFVGTEFDGIFRSDDNGENWTNVNAGLTDRKVVVMKAVGTKLFAGTFSNGVFYSTDKGDNWFKTSHGTMPSHVTCFALIGTKLFAGTVDSGLWKIDVNSVNAINDSPAHQHQFLCYPSPASNTLTISGTSPLFKSAFPVQYTVTSITGETLLETENSEPQFTISTDFLGSGVYCLTARQGIQRSSTLFSIFQ